MKNLGECLFKGLLTINLTTIIIEKELQFTWLNHCDYLKFHKNY